jgi:hypothetical protein
MLAAVSPLSGFTAEPNGEHGLTHDIRLPGEGRS